MTTDDDTNNDPHGPAHGPEGDERGSSGPEGQEDPNDAAESHTGTQDDDGETFSRTYVQKIRRENQNYRERAKKGETALSRLTAATMKEATSGILVDPTDLEFDEETMTDDDGLPDSEKIKEAAEELVSKKPHLAPRRPRGDIGQHKRTQDDSFSLADVLRSNAG